MGERTTGSRAGGAATAVRVRDAAPADSGTARGPDRQDAAGRTAAKDLSVARKVLALLTPDERRRVYLLMPVVIVMALLEVVGIASILPFLSLVGDPMGVHENAYLSRVYHALGFESETSFLFMLGILAFTMLALSNGFSAYTTWIIDKFSWMQAHRMSLRLLATYLDKPYVFFLNNNTSDLSKRILAEVQQVVSGILMPGLRGIAKGFASLFILGFLIALNPLLAVVALGVLGGAYFGIYVFVRRKLARIGKENVAYNRYRYQYTYEALNGIKEAKILGKEPAFVQQFETPSRRAAYNSAINHIIGTVPRYALEVLAFGGIILIVLFLLAAQQNVGQVLTIIGAYAAATYRLMPALQQVFSATTKIRFNTAALDSLYEGAGAKPGEAASLIARAKRDTGPLEPLPFRRSIELRDVRFYYPDTDEPVLQDMNIEVKAKTSVAFVGATGSGKSTTIDIILGLLRPERGSLRIDGVDLDEETLPRWQRNLGYVPQSIYLSDASVARNIAFGVPEHEIDMEAVHRAAKVANIHDFIESDLPKGYRTFIGERGVRLSGGQRQRIGIARALYHDPEVLVLDEATSALDGKTEESVFQAVEAVAESKTVIMIAHRMSTIRNCDAIYVLERGRVVASGTYDELLRTSEHFRALAKGSERPTVAAGSSR